MPNKKPFTDKSKDLSIMAGRMYRLLYKIASNKEIWTLKEVRDLISEINEMEAQS